MRMPIEKPALTHGASGRFGGRYSVPSRDRIAAIGMDIEALLQGAADHALRYSSLNPEVTDIGPCLLPSGHFHASKR